MTGMGGLAQNAKTADSPPKKNLPLHSNDGKVLQHKN